jgi:hypothetical protein
MPILVLSLDVAPLVCALLLASFGPFTTISLAHRIEERVGGEASEQTR